MEHTVKPVIQGNYLLPCWGQQATGTVLSNVHANVHEQKLPRPERCCSTTTFSPVAYARGSPRRNRTLLPRSSTNGKRKSFILRFTLNRTSNCQIVLFGRAVRLPPSFIDPSRQHQCFCRSTVCFLVSGGDDVVIRTRGKEKNQRLKRRLVVGLHKDVGRVLMIQTSGEQTTPRADSCTSPCFPRTARSSSSVLRFRVVDSRKT